MTDRSRRNFLRQAAGAVLVATGGRALAQSTQPATTTISAASQPAKIDRRAVVTRHDVIFDHIDLSSPLQVGNGDFAFGLDVTGMQTLADAYRPKVPLNTMAQWAWHSDPSAESYTLDDVTGDYVVAGRNVPYAPATGEFEGQITAAAAWLRGNPHRISLARIALVSAGVAIKPEDLSNIAQRIELWTGIVTSAFDYKGKRITVTTVAHPSVDAVAFRIVAPELYANGDLAVEISFPAAHSDWKNPDDWNRPESHTTVLKPLDGGAHFDRSQDDATYAVRATWTGAATLAQTGPHAFDLNTGDQQLELVVEFAPRPFDAPAAKVADVASASVAHWAAFWQSGAAIDFAACTDPRAPELERRIVLSQYLTAVHCAGSLPPQEAGLVCNSWYGKHQLDTHWWHAAHFAMWARFPLLDRSLKFYEAILPRAQAQAKKQGYAGARWPRLTDTHGRETPSEIGVFLIWQQPHPIHYAELAYRAVPTRETLDRFLTIVDETAHFMASYARYDERGKRYVLGPALVPAQETYWPHRETTLNPTFELAYWAWGLGVAQKWRERLGKPREDHWDDVIEKLAKPTVREGRYAAIETEPYLENADHPSFLMALGLLPKTHLVDEAIMRETARWTKAKWKWNDAWGWDFAVLAQTAARLGEAELAMDALTIESVKNSFAPSGHNFQSEQLPVYLPGNGALLAAIALMAGGWEGGPEEPTPGFPKNGRWDVKVEGFGRVI